MRMMRYAELYGNIKKPRIKSLGDNKMNINALNNMDLTDTTCLLPKIDTNISTMASTIGETIKPNIDLGVDSVIGKQLEAMGKLIFIYILH